VNGKDNTNPQRLPTLMNAVLTRKTNRSTENVCSNNLLNIKKMKKIGKLTINAEKVIKNEELVNLRGGYDTIGCCVCKDSSGNNIGTIAGTTCNYCFQDCQAVYGASQSACAC
jgi:hypothetical protein